MRPTPRSARLAAVVLCAGACLSACAGSLADPSGGIDGPVLTSDLPGEGSGGNDAIVAGGLALEDGCLYLVPGEAVEQVPPGVRYAVIWPHGTRWDADAEAVVLTNGDAVATGETVTGGGGYVSPGAGSDLGQDVVDEALRCAEGGSPGEVAVFNPGSAVERG